MPQPVWSSVISNTVLVRFDIEMLMGGASVNL